MPIPEFIFLVWRGIYTPPHLTPVWPTPSLFHSPERALWLQYTVEQIITGNDY